MTDDGKEVEVLTRWKDPTIEEYRKEIERLNDIIKVKDEGIKAFAKDLCDTTEELERANNKNLELIELINKIWNIIENDKITGIEARLMIQEILEKEN